MTQIKTKRLTISPLTNAELARLADQYREIVPELSAAYREMLEGCIKYPAQSLWYTAWKICLLCEPQEIGYAGFKGLHGGSVEIGYGINEGWEGMGYATEAAAALCAWVLRMPGVAVVEAETDAENAASKRVLAKCGFVPTGVTGKEGPRYILKKQA